MANVEKRAKKAKVIKLPNSDKLAEKAVVAELDKMA